MIVRDFLDKKMGHSVSLIRNYRSGDFEGLIRFLFENEERGQMECRMSSQGLKESLGQPNHFPEDNLFIAERAGKIIGYMDVKPELGIRRVVLNFLTDPKARQEEVPIKLIERATSRTRELGVKIIHVNILKNSEGTQEMLKGIGFRFIRRYLELRLDLSKVDLPEIGQKAFPCRSLNRGEEEKLAQIQNRSFSDTWGYHPNTVKEIFFSVHFPPSLPEDIFLIFDGDRPVGFCWTKVKVGKDEAGGEGMGRIHMLGVDPDHRKSGIGKQVLRAGLFSLKKKGLHWVELTVDSKNKAACALYRSVGFKPWTSSLWYEKRLN